MLASAIVRQSSPRSSRSQRSASISCTALAQPTRQGVHWPQLSSSKKRSMLSAAARALSRSERITTAAEPMKVPSGCSVSKSSGTSPSEAGSSPDDGPPGW